MNDIISFIKSNGTKEKPVTSAEIELALKTHGVTVRKEINKARCEGHPICSCDKGYYYSEDKTDIVETIQGLMKRTMSVEKAINGLITNLK